MKNGKSGKLLEILKARFDRHMHRHRKCSWEEVVESLHASSDKFKSLQAMEVSGGEPDVIGMDERTGEFLFVDCSPESPADRRSLCYDDEALKSRKANKPAGSAVSMAKKMGIELLDEGNYRKLHELGAFDRKSSSWIKTPAAIREQGGALFADRRYDRVFVYHNGAESYFAARGFRGLLRI